MSDIEKDIVSELNKVRTDAKRFAKEYLIPRRRHYNGKFYRKSKLMLVKTKEGIEALNECINVLTKQEKMKPFYPSISIHHAARDHVNDTGPKGIIGHIGSDGSDLQMRILKHGYYFNV